MESEKSSEFRERGSVFKQMAEMKKKIQLVEGTVYILGQYTLLKYSKVLFY